jgi:hypothetical protein
VTWTFIQRLVVVDRDHQLRTARPEQGLLDGGGVHRVAVGQQHALGERVARHPQRVGVVPLQRLRVEHELDLEAVAALQLGHALLDALGRVARHDHGPLEADAAEVAEGDVEDRAIPVDGQQRLRQLRGLRPQARSRACREHHPDHCASSSSSS